VILAALLTVAEIAGVKLRTLHRLSNDLSAYGVHARTCQRRGGERIHQQGPSTHRVVDTLCFLVSTWRRGTDKVEGSTDDGALTELEHAAQHVVVTWYV
jgi:hypothetical protein